MSPEWQLGIRSDKFQAAVIMYSFLKKEVYNNASDEFKPDWSDDKFYSYKQLQLKHLIKLLLADRSLAISDILAHPFFMSVNDMVLFEDRFRSFSSDAKSPHLDAHMNADKRLVFETQTWTEKVPEEVVEACAKGPSKTFISLWQARRNRRHHHDEDKYRAKRYLGELYTKNFEFWEKRFPAFFLYLFIKLITYSAPKDHDLLFETPEFFKSEFFPASKKFYIACSNQTIYD